VVRVAAVLALVTAIALWSQFAPSLPYVDSEWGNVAILSFGVIPAMFGLVWLCLPLRAALTLPQLAIGAATLALLALAFSLADLEIAANLLKLAAATAVGWVALAFFEAPWWVALVALMIIPVDLFSVARGPTKEITENQPQVFDALSISMLIPGRNEDGQAQAAHLGLPDVLFFGLFLGACARFGLRVAPTWVLMVLSFGGTLVLAVWFDQAGVAALPLLSAGFILANCDLLWASIRGRRRYPG
jgi:hypothetical protein